MDFLLGTAVRAAIPQCQSVGVTQLTFQLSVLLGRQMLEQKQLSPAVQ